MPGPFMKHVFLPCWRDGRLLFFTDIKESYTARLEYRVAAATSPGSLLVERTHKAQISAEQLAKCQETADNGAALQRFFNNVGGGNIGHLVDSELLPLPPCAEGTTHLIYICSYLNLLRKYSVDEQIIRAYEEQGAPARFNPESSFSIYKILAAHLQPERASGLIDEDIQNLKQLRGQSTAISNLLREAAVIKFDVGDCARAEEMMLHAVGLLESEDKWRRLADISLAANNQERAIEYFLKAEALVELNPPQALRLADLLIKVGRIEEAEAFLERAAPNFPKPVEKLRKQLLAAR